MTMLTDSKGNPLFHKEDQELQKILDYFLGFISAVEWTQRKRAIEQKVDFDRGLVLPSEGAKQPQIRINDEQDTIGWYLYLLEKQLHDPQQYEHIAGARVIPLFKRIGASLDLLITIEGIRKKVKHLMKKDRAAADGTLFEILVALLWTRNGWKVSVIPEKPPGKSPDLLAERDGEKWYIECKRMNKSSEYSKKERSKFLAMLEYITQTLLKHGALLDITFHIELEELPDDFLEQKLPGKIALATQPTTLISNDTWEVSISFIDYDQITKHLEKWSVKKSSPQLCNLIAGKKVDTSQYSVGIIAQYAQMGKGSGNGEYVTDIQKAFGVKWNCDAEEAIEKKARDIKRQLVDACEQFPQGQNAAIHVCIETLDGAKVEDLRLEKITETLQRFDLKGKILAGIYCHFVKSYAPADQNWVYDETVSSFYDESTSSNYPLDVKHAILPDEIKGEDGAHWNRPSP